MEGSIKLNPIFLRGVKRHLLDIESWAGKVITPGVINKQTVSKPWQSSTFYWLVGNLIRAQQGSIILIYLTELFLLRNEIIVAIRKKICTSPSSMHGCSSVSSWLWENNRTPIQTSYFIGPCNLHYLLFSGIGALLCHHPHCFPSQSQTLFGMGAGRPPITAIARWLFRRENTLDFAGGRGGGLRSLF